MLDFAVLNVPGSIDLCLHQLTTDISLATLFDTGSSLATFTDWSFISPVLATAGGKGESYVKALGLAVTLSTVAVYLFAQIFGEMSVRIGLPAVLGELIAGLVIGVSGMHLLVLEDGGLVAESSIQVVQLMSGASTDTVREIFAGPVKIIFERYADIGVGILLFAIGLEADLKELIRVGPQAAAVAVAGVFLPFVMGFLGLTYIFHVSAIPAMFAGAALTATSIGITSRILQDMGVLGSREGQTILGAAVLDDILGIAILAVVVGIAEHGTVEVSSIVSTIVSAGLFVVAAIVLNRVFGPLYIEFLDNLHNPASVLIGAILFLTVLSTIASAIGLEGILGCFAAGIVLGDTKATKALEEACEPLVALFATVFFVTIGANTDLSVLNLSNPDSREGLTIAAFLIIVAIMGKMAAGYFAITKDKIDRLAIGTGMIPRGEVGLVFAGLGAATGALPDSIDVAIVLMVIGTTFVAPPMLRWVFARGGAEPVTASDMGDFSSELESE
ncbi:MAG: cation:proton antiporter [Cyanobacteria bacterium P01_A01_bin.3]